MQCYSPFGMYSPYQQQRRQQPFMYNRQRTSPFGYMEDSDDEMSPWDMDSYYQRQNAQRQQQERLYLQQLERQRQQELQRQREAQRQRELQIQEEQLEREYEELERQRAIKLCQETLREQQQQQPNKKKAAANSVNKSFNNSSPSYNSSSNNSNKKKNNRRANRRARKAVNQPEFLPFSGFFGNGYEFRQPDESEDTESESQADLRNVVNSPRFAPVSNNQKAATDSVSDYSDKFTPSESETEFEDAEVPDHTDYESSSEDAESAPVSTPAPQAPPQVSISEALKSIEASSQMHIDTYNRINNSYLKSQTPPSSEPITSSIYNSWIKVLQKSQMGIEKLYEQLDRLDVNAITPDERALKKQLTKQTVQYADKIENLVAELQENRAKAKKLEDEQNEEKKESNSEQERKEDKAPEQSLNTTKPARNSQNKKNGKAKTRKVLVEEVPDESFSD